MDIVLGCIGRGRGFRLRSGFLGAGSGLVYDGNRVSKTVNGVTTNYLVDTNNLARYAQVVEELSTQHCPGLHDAHRRVSLQADPRRSLQRYLIFKG